MGAWRSPHTPACRLHRAARPCLYVKPAWLVLMSRVLRLVLCVALIMLVVLSWVMEALFPGVLLSSVGVFVDSALVAACLARSA